MASISISEEIMIEKSVDSKLAGKESEDAIVNPVIKIHN